MPVVTAIHPLWYVYLFIYMRAAYDLGLNNNNNIIIIIIIIINKLIWILLDFNQLCVCVCVCVCVCGHAHAQSIHPGFIPQLWNPNQS
jgi:heme/copper-type cytochrome/quinol oxidase subunit 4